MAISVWVKNGGIVSRGVLLDYYSWAARNNIEYDPFTRYAIPVPHLKRLVEEEGIDIQPGDVLFIRSGFTKKYESLTPAEEESLPARKEGTFVGVESSLETARWLWENQFSAVAGDMPGFEQSPIWNSEVQLHQWLLAGWGMPIGEMFYLEDLARECERLGRKTFFISSMPLKVSLSPASVPCRHADQEQKVPGGVASPPNAVAIL